MLRWGYGRFCVNDVSVVARPFGVKRLMRRPNFENFRALSMMVVRWSMLCESVADSMNRGSKAAMRGSARYSSSRWCSNRSRWPVR